MSNKTFSPRKALDFADKSQEYKGRNLFEDNYNIQQEKCEEYDHPFLSPEFKQDDDSNEVYTPSFDHKNQYYYKHQSPLSFLKQFKDVSAQKTAEPPYLRKRRNKFKQKVEEVEQAAHYMAPFENQRMHYLWYPQSGRGASLPPPYAHVHKGGENLLQG